MISLLLFAAPALPKTEGEIKLPDAARLKQLMATADYDRLTARLQAVNSDIARRGLHDFPGGLRDNCSRVRLR